MKFTNPIAAAVISGVVFAGPNPNQWFSAPYAIQPDNVSINIIASPGPTKRLRVYAAFITGVLNGGGTGSCFCSLNLVFPGGFEGAFLTTLINNSGINVPVPIIIPPAGLVIPGDSGIKFVLQGDGTNFFAGAVNVYYSIEPRY